MKKKEEFVVKIVDDRFIDSLQSLVGVFPEDVLLEMNQFLINTNLEQKDKFELVRILSGIKSCKCPPIGIVG